MPQSLSQIYLHLVFSTKNRQPFLRNQALRDAMHAYLAGICRNLGCPATKIGGVADHVHVSCRLGRTVAPADLLRDLKRPSSIWAKEHGIAAFQWQAGYGAFSVSPSDLAEIEAYIAHQEEHHRRETFQDEFRRLLRAYGLEWDERYVWD